MEAGAGGQEKRGVRADNVKYKLVESAFVGDQGNARGRSRRDRRRDRASTNPAVRTPELAELKKAGKNKEEGVAEVEEVGCLTVR